MATTEHFSVKVCKGIPAQCRQGYDTFVSYINKGWEVCQSTNNVETHTRPVYSAVENSCKVIGLDYAGTATFKWTASTNMDSCCISNRPYTCACQPHQHTVEARGDALKRPPAAAATSAVGAVGSQPQQRLVQASALQYENPRRQAERWRHPQFTWALKRPPAAATHLSCMSSIPKWNFQ